MDARWWQRGVVYQVYPRSFHDSDRDGIGDLRGIRKRLDHLEWLEVDAVWLSPIFPSPMADFGYDVADYTDVDALFGSLSDLDALADDLHRRGMRLLLDFVPNHTSDRHAWFLDAASSRSAEHRDWYIWRDPAPDGGPPNTWQSAFNGSAWEWHASTGQYYFHSFLKEQPDLDWTNPAVVDAMSDVLRLWFRRGIDGFRIDVVNLLAKDRELRPSISRSRQVWGDQQAIIPILRRLRDVSDEFEDRVLIGEVWLSPKRLVVYYGHDLDGLHLPFNLQLLLLEWSARAVRDGIVRYESLLPAGAWPNWVLSNHDCRRVATRVGVAQARVAAMLLLTLRGTPTLYYGDEIGMVDVNVPRSERVDPQGLRGGASRDPARTPMRWDGSATAGFTTGTPWLPIGPWVGEINVAAQSGDPDSMLSLHRALLHLRRSEPALNMGSWQDLGIAGTTLAYVRSDGDRKFLVCLNLAHEPSPVPDAARQLRGRVVVSTLGMDGLGHFDPDRDLLPDEGSVVLID